MEIRTVHIGGAFEGDMAYALWQPARGARGDVVCLHGLSRQKRDFDFIAQFLAGQGYRVFSFDAPGRGESMRFADPDLYRLDVCAVVMAGALQALGLSAVHWIGTSMGGLAAMAMAEKGLHGVFKTLTLIDITHRPNRAACDRIASYMTETLPVLPSVESYIEFLKANLPLGDVDDRVWRHYAEHQLVRTAGGYTFHFDPMIARRAQKDLREGLDLTQGLERIDCPLTLVAGGKSDLCTRAEIEEFLKLKPRARLRICEDAGHVPALADRATQEFILEGLKG